jgi:hypothetical protein
VNRASHRDPGRLGEILGGSAPALSNSDPRSNTVREWLVHFSSSFADQSATWFVGVVLAVLGIFSARIVEAIKVSLNRADLRTKYYEEMAIDISHFVFIIDRLAKVYYGSEDEEDKSPIAIEYDEIMNAICRKEYVYLSWLRRYWGADKSDGFRLVMEKIRAVDATLIRMRGKGESDVKQLETDFYALQKAADALLLSSL